MELETLIRVWRRRLPLVALLGLLCGGAAWLAALGEAEVHEQELSFVLRPADGLPIEEADRVAGTLADRDSAITQTILGLVESVPAGNASGSNDIERTVTVRPGSNIIDVALSGDAEAVAASGRSVLASAPQLIRRSYRMYELELLGSAGVPTEKPSTLWRTLALAVLLGCAVALAVAALEYRAYGRPSPDVADTEDDPDFPTVFQQEPTPTRTSRAEP